MFNGNNSRFSYLCIWKLEQLELEECKYVKTNVRTKNYIDMELESESDGDSDSDNDIDIDHEE